MSVKQAFTVPIYEYIFSSTSFELIQQEIMLSIKSCKQDLSNPWPELVSSTFNFAGNNDFINQYNLNYFKEQVLTHCNEYLKQISAKPNKFVFGASWLNVLPPNGFQYAHHHPDSVISGVYYYQSIVNDSNIVFENPNPVVDFIDPTEQIWPNQFSAEAITGKLLLFPSWLKHRVTMNQTQFDRIAVAFNLNISQ